MAKETLKAHCTGIDYTLFGKPVKKNTLLHTICETYYGDFLKLEKDLSKETNTDLRCIMLDIREAFWCNEFRTDNIDLRRKILYENYYSATTETIPI